jgi:hypothetical protein
MVIKARGLEGGQPMEKRPEDGIRGRRAEGDGWEGGWNTFEEG